MWFLLQTHRTLGSINRTNRQKHQQHLKAARLSALLHVHLRNSLTDFDGTRIHVKINLVK